jgi:hypothetical protein
VELALQVIELSEATLQGGVRREQVRHRQAFATIERWGEEEGIEGLRLTKV